MNPIESRKTDWNVIWQKYGHWLYALILPVYLVFFFVAEAVVNSDFPYQVMYHPLDDLIPFCEWFYIPYVLWYPFMLIPGLYLGIKDPAGFRRYMTYIGVSFIGAVMLFLLFPTGQELRPDLTTLGRENFLTDAIGVLYQTDTNTNVCPSLHVVGSLAAVFGIFHQPRLRRTIWMPVGAVALCILITLSTVFLKQHSVLDVFWALPYSFSLYGLIYLLPPLLRKSAAQKSSSIEAE